MSSKGTSAQGPATAPAGASAAPAEIGARLERRGATFVQPVDALAERLARVRGLVFDWDGVFNSGEKGQGVSSGFSEADSMGINMLRYALWRRDGVLPLVAIITGEPNPSAELFARRERFHALYHGVKDKGRAMAHLRGRHALEPTELACVFDDINDVAMASGCGIRILVRRRASGLFRDYLIGAGACDYVTACESGEYAVREAAELMLALSGRFEEVIASRCAHDHDYRAYLAAREAVELDVPAADVGL